MYAATLDDYLGLVDHGRMASSTNDRADRRLRRLAGSLPATIATFFGFERRLHQIAHATDFAFSLSECGLQWARGSHRWPELHDLLRLVCPPDETAVWLEFDTSRPGRAVAPSVFIACNREAALALGAGLLQISNRASFDTCVKASPSDQLQVGAMPSRRSGGLRLCVLWLDRPAVGKFLRAIAWPGDLAALATLLDSYAGVCDAFGVHVDVGEEVAAHLGLELMYRGRVTERQPDREPRWRELFSHLVEDGLCFGCERDALLDWPSVREIEAPLVERLIAAVVPSEQQLLHGTLRRGLQHVKLLLDRRANVRAKAYYGAVFEAA